MGSQVNQPFRFAVSNDCSRRQFVGLSAATGVSFLWLGAGSRGWAADKPDASIQRDGASQFAQCVDRGVNYLQKAQAADGSFSARIGIGVTALVATSLLRLGRAPRDPMVEKALKFLEGAVQPDGGIYSRGGRLANYETCICIMCFGEANQDKRYSKLIERGEAFVRKCPWGAETKTEPSDYSFGGAGYGQGSRPDLSNTAFLIDALKSCGRGADDPDVKRALVFVSRCQNLESEHNTTPFAAKNPDGGFYYTCAAEGGGSPAGQTPNGGLRSYGAMSYSGLKSMLYAGLKPNDPRVKAAVAWARKHYDVTSNPGLGDAGLYYYYHLFAKTLDVLGENPFVDADGKKHDWRRELTAELARRQQDDGSWVNTNRQWMENDPNLATGFALLSLSYCSPAAAKR